MEQPNYECLPQRAPRQKRKRAKISVDPQENASDPDNATVAAPNHEKTKATAAATAAGGLAAQEEPNQTTKAMKPSEENEDAPSEAGSEPAEYRACAVPGQKFEYLDHTADVQLHAWGENLQEAFENVALCMFNYMTPLEGISLSSSTSGKRTYKAEAHDLPSLVYHWLDELLFEFSTDFFVPKSLRITTFDRENWKIEAEAEGELFDRQRHVSGTEIKAITYSAMQINEKEGDAELFVIVDI